MKTARPNQTFMVIATLACLATCSIDARNVYAQIQAAATSQPAETQKLVTNVFYDTSLRQALWDIASQTGVIIVPDSSVQGMVTCELADTPLEQALEVVLAGTGFAVKKMPNYYLVCSASPDDASYHLVCETELVKLSYLKADEAVKMLSPSFRQFAQPTTASNAICITGPPKILERVLADIRMIDQPPSHVMLDARVVVIESQLVDDVGVQWSFPNIQAGVFTDSDFHGGGLPGPDWPWGIRIGYTPGKEFTDSLLMELNLLGLNDQATIVASPQVMAQDGKEAQIAVVNEEYFEIVSEGYYATSDLEKIETGTTLKIVPRIGRDGDITLEIETEVSDVVARGEDNLPVVTRRTATSTVRVENGGTAAIAGLMDRRVQEQTMVVPGISQVPLLGKLFTNEADRTVERQVAVFITARLMPQEHPDLEVLPRPVNVTSPIEGDFQQQLRSSIARLRQKGQRQ